jgi:hypothetical protein
LMILLFVFVIAYTTANGTQLSCMDLIFINQTGLRETLNFQQLELLKKCVEEAAPVAALN